MKKLQANTMPPPATMPAIAPAEEIRLGVLVGALAKTAPIAIATRTFAMMAIKRALDLQTGMRSTSFDCSIKMNKINIS